MSLPTFYMMSGDNKAIQYLPGFNSRIIAKPITKSLGITMSPLQNSFPQNSFSSYPTGSVTIQRYPLYDQQIIGPPIIRLSPFINTPGAKTQIQISSNDQNLNFNYLINIPFAYIRAVTDYIYLNAQTNLNPTDPKVQFRVITPVLNNTVQSTFPVMLKIINDINAKYSGLQYTGANGQNQNLDILLNYLQDLVNKKNMQNNY
jgi:hypothetical protein